jgi:type IV pilus assembly protein PilQ
MKYHPRRDLFRLIFLMLAASVFGYGCTATAPVKPVPSLTINKIEPVETDGKTEIQIEGSEPILQYTSFQLTEPLRLVIDISDADISKLSNKIEVGKGAVLDIVPSQMDNIARVEISLNQSVDTKVYQAGGKLIAEFARPVEEAKSAPDIIEPVTAPPVETAAANGNGAPEKEKPAKGTATIVNSVRAVAGKDGVQVVISANGTMVPSTFMVEGKKLVIDIPGARSKVKPAVIPVRKGGIDKVRVGQHEQKVRVVLDLTAPLSYNAVPKGNTVMIAMLPAAAVAEKAPQEKASAQEAEKKPVTETETPVPVPIAKTERPQEQKDQSQVLKGTSIIHGTGSVIGASKYSGRRISLDLQDADLVNVMRLFGEVANLNMILSPEVRGKVTVRMVNIPWDQAMDIILKMNGLGYVLEDNILRIASVGALTKEAEEEARAKETKKKAEDLITRVVSVNYAKASEISGTLKKSLSARGETVVDERTNTIIIKDIARNVDEVLALLKLLDKPIPQVMIEARIVEATTSFTREIGVQWGGSGTASSSYGNATGFSFPNSIAVTGGSAMGTTTSGNGNWLVNMPASAGDGSGGSIGFSFGSLTKALSLDLVLSAMESTGQGKVISTPRVSALDNKEAKIQQGQSIPYSTTSAGGTSVQFIQANLELNVTPHVTPDSKIFMKIKATKNAADTSLLGAGGQPSIRSNEATTEILLGDGETAVIGGILILDRGETIQKVPFFADIPLIGWLFKKTSVKDDKRELLIFITPKIIKQEII